jgi:hypothetical protein
MGRVNSRADSEHEARLLYALEALQKDKTLSLRAAALKYGVSRTTLTNRRDKGTGPRNQAHTDQQLLSEEEEDELQRWVEKLDDSGIPPRLSHLHSMVVAIRQRNGSRVTAIGDHWISRFLTRHPTLATRFAGRINQERDAGTRPASIESFFNRLSEVKSRYQIQPMDMWNADEKGFAIGVAKKAKVLCRRSRRNPRIRQPGNREWVTLFEAVSAMAQTLPGCYVYKGEAHIMGNHDYEERDEASFAISSTGWSNDAVGFKWLVEHFEPATRSGRPRLLILDGHSSHLTVEFIDFSLLHNIHLLCFPSHSTHLL